MSALLVRSIRETIPRVYARHVRTSYSGAGRAGAVQAVPRFFCAECTSDLAHCQAGLRLRRDGVTMRRVVQQAMTHPNRLAELRAVARVRHGSAFTQEELAARVGVSRPTLASWEAGDTVPTIVQAVALARELGASLDELGYGPDRALA